MTVAIDMTQFQFEEREQHLDLIRRADPFQTQGAPCFEAPANDEDWYFLYAGDPEEAYQP